MGIVLRGLDSDNYDGIVPARHFARLHDEFGMRFNIIGLEAGMPYARQQRDACLSVGIDVPFAYKFLYWDVLGPDLERMKAATAFGKPIAIDCEYDVPAGWSKAQVVNRIQEAKDLLIREGLYWGIYTGAWWWPLNTGDSTAFKDDKLWHAAYPFGDGQPPLDFLPGTQFDVTYGGWKRPEVFQYANNCYGDTDGPWDFDMNSYEYPDVIPPPPPVPVPVPVRDFGWGSEIGGVERRGNQLVTWLQHVEVAAQGDVAGLEPFSQWARATDGTWVRVA